jgi:transposase
MERKTYPSDISDDAWAFSVPYVTLMTEDAPQRDRSLRAVLNGLRWIVRAGAAWRLMPHDLPPWYTVYQQSQRWLKAGVFEAIVQALRARLRLAQGRAAEPSAAMFDSRTLQSTPDSGTRAGYDGAKRRRGSKVHIAVDTLGYLLALHGTPANLQDRAQVARLAERGQDATGDAVEITYVDQGDTGAQAAQDAEAPHMQLAVVKLSEAKKGFSRSSRVHPSPRQPQARHPAFSSAGCARPPLGAGELGELPVGGAGSKGRWKCLYVWAKS